MHDEWYGVVTLLCFLFVEVRYVLTGGVNVFQVCLDFALSMVLRFVSMVVVYSVLLYVVCFLRLGVFLLCCDVV